MLRNIAGIMADEEPKTPITSSGNANMTYFGNSGGDITLSEGLLAGKSTWSISFWATPVTTIGDHIIYEEDIDGDLASIELSASGLRVSIPTTESTTTLIEYSFSFIPEGEVHFYVITAGGMNDYIRIFRDGIEKAVAVKPYRNKWGPSTAVFKGDRNHSLSSFATYSTRLSPTDIAENLYIYDEDLLFAGARGFDSYVAGTPIKDNLTHFFSFTEGISYSGNEFHDKVGGAITLGNTSGLEFNTSQLYVYTDVNDLPGGEPVIFPVSSANFSVGAGSARLAGSTVDFIGTNSFSQVAFIKFDTTAGVYLFGQWTNTIGSNGIYGFRLISTDIQMLYGPAIANQHSFVNYADATINDNAWHCVIAYVDVISENIFWNVDGVDVASKNSGTIGTPWGRAMNANGALMLGSRDGFSSGYEGFASFAGIAVGVDLRTVASDLYVASQTARCWGSLQPSTQALFTRFYEAGTYNGSSVTDAIEDKTGNNDLVNTGVTFTDEGLTVECDS